MTGDPVEAVERALEALGADPWNAFLHVDAEGARLRARDVARQALSKAPLAGLVVSIKDNLARASMPMTCGSRHLAHYRPPYTATCVARLEAAGAVVLGKTNMDEFAAGSSGENSAFGPTRNPRDLERVPGGSSSGAGASVAAGVVPLALGSDTGGSVRAPAAFCGVAALKPTYGLVSRHGLGDLAMSLEGPAPLAADVRGLALMLDAIAGPDPHDAAMARAKSSGRGFAEGLDEAAPDALRVGVPREFFEGVAPDVARLVRAALGRLEAKGATLVEVSLPSLRHALSAYYVLNYAELASAMARYDGVRYGDAEAGRAGFGAEVKRRILLGTFVTSREERRLWYEAALRARAEVARDYARALADVDVLMGPTMPTRAFRLGERAKDPAAMYAADVLTVSANLAGVPAGSVPVRADGLPVGLQVLGRAGEDALVLRAMRAVEALEDIS